MPRDTGPVHDVKATLFRGLGHPARVHILELLRGDERSVGAVQAELGLDSGDTLTLIARQLTEQQSILQNLEAS